jgi:hypothetical protein
MVPGSASLIDVLSSTIHLNCLRPKVISISHSVQENCSLRAHDEAGLQVPAVESSLLIALRLCWHHLRNCLKKVVIHRIAVSEIFGRRSLFAQRDLLRIVETNRLRVAAR